MDVDYILEVILANQPVLHSESMRGYASHLETVSCEFLDLEEMEKCIHRFSRHVCRNLAIASRYAEL